MSHLSPVGDISVLWTFPLHACDFLMRTQGELAAATSEIASLKEQLVEHQAQEKSLQACHHPCPVHLQ